MRTRSGQTIPVSLSGSQITTDDPQFQGTIFVARNITERKRAERRIRYLARYDALTKMPNRMQFQHLLQQAIARARRNDTRLALLYLDMDRFKEINDTFGHAAGDRTLEMLSERLTRACRRKPSSGGSRATSSRLFIEGFAASRQPRHASRSLARMRARRSLQGLLRRPAGSIPDGEHRRRLLSEGRRERHRPDPQRRRRDVPLQAERRQHASRSIRPT